LSRHPLDYPFDAAEILRKKKSLRRTLLEGGPFLDKKIAILGGSTTAEIKDILELFLLKAGIRPTFYQSEYNKYHEDVMFSAPELLDFKPDLVYIHTSSRNISAYPGMSDSTADVEQRLENQLAHFRALWDKIESDLACPIIQNNFEEPWDRPLGNLDAWDPRGRSRFTGALNSAFAAEAARRPSLYLQDLHYLASQYGLLRWHDRSLWYLYKYALAYEAIPPLAHNLAAMVGAMFGASRKCLVLDLDNTLWGGVIGDDGIEGIQLGPETPEGEVFAAIQRYAKDLKERGIILAVSSKNEDATARSGFSHPDSAFSADDFASFKANWFPKPESIAALAGEINIGIDSLVFLDDNPAERALVRAETPLVAVPELGSDAATYLDVLDNARYFETLSLSGDDLQRSEQYALNAKLSGAQAQFVDYDSFLKHLEMQGDIQAVSPLYHDRVAQLINKSNQFNVTTRRYTLNEVAAAAADPAQVTLYGRLKDRFGDHGLVSVVLASPAGQDLAIDLWVMSCRVLKRGLEQAMLEQLILAARAKKYRRLLARYLPTAKNGMVKDLFTSLGFALVERKADGEASWTLDLATAPLPQHFISTRNAG
jgi:FkbH-like protein